MNHSSIAQIVDIAEDSQVIITIDFTIIIIRVDVDSWYNYGRLVGKLLNGRTYFVRISEELISVKKDYPITAGVVDCKIARCAEVIIPRSLKNLGTIIFGNFKIIIS